MYKIFLIYLIGANIFESIFLYYKWKSILIKLRENILVSAFIDGITPLIKKEIKKWYVIPIIVAVFIFANLFVFPFTVAALLKVKKREAEGV